MFDLLLHLVRPSMDDLDPGLARATTLISILHY